jgi:TatD DNase family protein
LAKKFNLPIVIHNREAKDDILEILKQEDFKDFIFHCYSEDLDFALKLLEFSPNCKIGFSGVVTFKNAKEIQETAKNIPLKNILAETDSPFLTPVPYR